MLMALAPIAITFGDTVALGSVILGSVAAVTGFVIAVAKFGRSTWRDLYESKRAEAGELDRELKASRVETADTQRDLMDARAHIRTLEKQTDIIELVKEQREGNAQIVTAVRNLAETQATTLLEAIGQMLDPTKQRRDLGVDEALAKANRGHEQVMERLAASEERIVGVLQDIAADITAATSALTALARATTGRENT